MKHTTMDYDRIRRYVRLFDPDIMADQEIDGEAVLADSKSGCGSPAKTGVHYTLDRDLDFVPQFPNTPPPQYDFVLSVNESPGNWLGEWVDDNFWSPPVIYVSIAPSTTASGLYAISIKEEIDRRFNLVFETNADPISPNSALPLLPYKDNVPGTVQPWSSHPVSPGALQVFAAKLSPDASGVSVAGSPLLTVENPEPLEPYIALTWKRPFTGGTPPTVAKSAVAGAFVPPRRFRAVAVLRDR